MKQLVCEMCGGTNFVKQEGVFVCQTCGLKYSIEEARKMMMDGDGAPGVPATVTPAAPAKPDNSEAVANYLMMSRNALETSNNEEAELYANKVIELDPKNSEAWEIKGEAAGWQSRAINSRIAESVSAWINAVTFAPEESKDELRDRIAGKYANLVSAMVNMHCGNFGNLPNDSNLASVKSTVKDCIAQMNALVAKAGIPFNISSLIQDIANQVNKAAVAGSNYARKDYGPDYRNMQKWQWEKYYGAIDNCLELVDLAQKLNRTDDLGKTICENYRILGESARDSQSWKYNASSYYVDYAFTDKAKEIRTKAINEFKEKKKEYEKGRLKITKDYFEQRRENAGKEAAKYTYWAEHQNEKAKLEKEREDLKVLIDGTDEKLRNLPEQQLFRDAESERADTFNRIKDLREEQNGLGMFKGKEKKAIQERIDELDAKLKQLESAKETAREKLAAAKKPIEEECDRAKVRIKEIRDEFDKDRGTASQEGLYYIPDSLGEGQFNVTPDQLLEELKKKLPEPLFVEEIKPANLYMHPDLKNLPAIFIKDSSIKDENKNTGVSIYMKADGNDQPIKEIFCIHSQELKAEKNFDIIKVMSLLLQMFQKEIKPVEADSVAISILLENTGCKYRDNGVRTEGVFFQADPLGMNIVSWEYIGMRMHPAK